MTEEEKITEEKIFDAAKQVFESKGLAGARMQDIADVAGINKALLHYYFRSKEKLFEAVFINLAEMMFRKLYGSLENDLPLEQKLEIFYREHISFLQSHPRMPDFILHEINQNPERIARILRMDRLRRVRQKLFNQIDEEIASGSIKPVDKMQLFINIVALSVFPFAARGLLDILLQEQNIDFDEFVEERKQVLPLFIINALKGS